MSSNPKRASRYGSTPESLAKLVDSLVKAQQEGQTFYVHARMPPEKNPTTSDATLEKLLPAALRGKLVKAYVGGGSGWTELLFELAPAAFAGVTAAAAIKTHDFKEENGHGDRFITDYAVLNLQGGISAALYTDMWSAVMAFSKNGEAFPECSDLDDSFIYGNRETADHEFGETVRVMDETEGRLAAYAKIRGLEKANDVGYSDAVSWIKLRWPNAEIVKSRAVDDEEKDEDEL